MQEKQRIRVTEDQQAKIKKRTALILAELKKNGQFLRISYAESSNVGDTDFPYDNY